MAIDPNTGLEKEETLKDIWKGLFEWVDLNAPEVEAVEEKPPVLTATKDQAVVERWTTEEEVPKIEFNREAFTDIQGKQNAGQTLTDEEKVFLGTIKAKRDSGQAFESIFGEEVAGEELLWEWIAQEIANKIATWKDLESIGLDRTSFQIESRIRDGLLNQGFSENQINQIIARKDAILQTTQREATAEGRISERQALVREQSERDIERIKDQVGRTQNQTQRLRSLRGVWRSTATEEEILDIERKWEELISAAQRKADLEAQAIRMQEEWASAEDISSINKAVSQQEVLLQQKINENLVSQKIIDSQLWTDFDESIQNMLGILEASGEDIGEFDDKATKALGYISDSKGNPLKLDEDGNPIAPKNEFWQDVKISQFKDTNENTYVYKNGTLDAIIDNQGNILKWDQLKALKVPASVQEDKQKEDQRKLEWQLRNEFIKRPETKRFQEIRAQFERVSQWAKADSAAWDIALVFSFMKMLDPGSVVRESEFATAANAQGIPEQLRNGYNKLLTGKRFWDNEDDLAVGLRADMLQRSKDLFDVELENFNTTRDSFSKIAEDAGGRSEFIFTSWEFWEDWLPIDIDTEADADSILDSLTWSATTTETVETDGEAVKITKESTFEDKSSFLDSDFNTPDTTGWTNEVSVTAWITKNRPDRNNNPWNVKLSPINESISTEVDDQGHLIFKTPEEWFKALQNDLFAKLDGRTRNEALKAKVLNKTATLEDLWRAYAEDPNWGRAVARILWISPTTKLSEVDRNKLLQAIPKQEWFTGTINS